MTSKTMQDTPFDNLLPASPSGGGRVTPPEITSPQSTIVPLPTPHEEREIPQPVVYPVVSNKRRYTLLAVFSLAQFIDIFAASGTVLAIERIAIHLSMTIPESIWIINGYALSFSCLLLAAGRLADIWNAKYVFCIGFAWLGAFSIGLGFVGTADGFIVLRAFQGCGAALTIPAAINLIDHLFPEPDKQAVAIAIFGGSGAVANTLGLLISGVFLLANYKWIFFFISMVAIPLALVAFFFTPDLSHLPPVALTDPVKEAEAAEAFGGYVATRPAKMDWLGTFCMTSGIALFIYGLTDANIEGWRSATALSTMLIGFFLFPVFFYVETLPEPIDALIYPRMWFITNFFLLSCMSLLPYFWWFAVQASLSQRMQDTWHNSPIIIAVRFLPQGIAALIIIIVANVISLKVFALRWRLVLGASGSAAGALMIAFGPTSWWYWRLDFLAFIIGSGGNALFFVSLNVALIMSVPSQHSGVAGGVFNTLLQLGVAVGLSITTALQASYRETPGGKYAWRGYKYSFFFVMSVFVVAAILSGFLFVDPVKVIEERRTATNLSQRVIDARIAAELARSQKQGDGGIAASGTERATIKSKEHREAALAEE